MVAKKREYGYIERDKINKGGMLMKIILYIVLAAIVIGGISGGLHLWKVAKKNAQEMAPFAELKPQSLDKNKKILVIYYSLTGHTQDIAERIKAQTNADLYAIKLKQALPTSFMAYYQIWKQYKDKRFPEVKGTMPDINEYDLVILGSPVWMYTVSTPMQSFLKGADFKKKPLAIYSTQGSNPGSFFTDMKKAIKNANVISEIEFNNLPKKYDEALNIKINQWLAQTIAKVK